MRFRYRLSWAAIFLMGAVTLPALADGPLPNVLFQDPDTTYTKICDPPIGLAQNGCSCTASDSLIGGGAICANGGLLSGSAPCSSAPAAGFSMNCAADGVPSNTWVAFCSNTPVGAVFAICIVH